MQEKNGSKFSQIEAVRLRGGDPPPPQVVSLTAFSQFFFTPSLIFEDFHETNLHANIGQQTMQEIVQTLHC